ncbi:hypothetical protein KWU48_12695, partial [Clostridioides difficile]|nr:hypothetical protein [Clostridioides difficile]
MTSKSKKVKKAIAILKEIRLLLNSECIKRYQLLPELLQTFSLNEKSIYIEDILYLKDENLETYGVLAYGFSTLLKEASEEWAQNGYKGKKKTTCQLCGSKKLEYNYSIKNKKNKKTMLIGFDCMSHFPSIENNNKNSNSKQEIKKDRILERINFINLHYENIEKVIENWQEYYRDIPLILPYDIDNRLKSTIRNARDFYNNFINLKLKTSSLPILQNYINDFTTLKDEADKFIKENKNNDFVARSSLKIWIKNHNPYLEERISINNGLIDKNIAKNIYNVDFIKHFSDKFKLAFTAIGFDIINISEEAILLNYKFNKTLINFYISPKNFMLLYSSLIYSDIEVLDNIHVFNKINLHWTDKNVDDFIYLLNQKMKKFNLKYYLKPVYIK